MRLRSSIVIALAACGGGTAAVTPEPPLSPDGIPTAKYPVPPEAPRGDVRGAAVGVARLDVHGARDLDVVHVRLTVTNRRDELPWVIDTREQLLEIAGEGRSRPVFVNSDRDAMPIVQVPMLQQRVLDLYYPLPPTLDPDELGEVTLAWQVRTGERLVTQRTTFARAPGGDDDDELDAAIPPTGLHAGWGPFWWHDPYYARRAFRHHRKIVVQTPPRVVVAQAPRGAYVARRDRRR